MPGPQITPAGLRNYIERVELPGRSSELVSGTVETIIRKGGIVGSVIHHQKSMGRTMDHARTHINQCENAGRSVSSGTVFIADQLTGSRGRFVRQWHAPEGGLWGSMIYVSTLLASTRMLLPLAVGVSCCEALRQIGVERAEIRWINDVLIDGKKVAGILMEGFYGLSSQEEYNLIGFGVNLNNNDFPEEIKDGATSVKNYLRDPVNLQDFTYCFLAKLTWNLGLLCHEEDHFLQEGQCSGLQGSHPLINRWRIMSSTIGRRVLYGFDVEKKPQYQAVVSDIDETGGLCMVLEDGSKIIEHSGEIRYLL